MDDPFVLSFLWILGLIAGVIPGIFSARFLSELIFTGLITKPSVLGLLAAMFFPFLLISLAWFFHWSAVASLVVFLKAFMLSYHASLLWVGFPGSGWLLGSLLFFSDFACSTVLWMFCIRSNRALGKDPVYRLIPAFAAVFLICSVDCSLISPFLGVVLLS